MLTVIPEKGDKLICIKQGVKGLTKGQEYEVVYRGGNHFIIHDDNEDRYMVTVYENMENFSVKEPEEIHVWDSSVYQLFATVLPEEETYEDGVLVNIDHHVDIAEGVRLTFETETESLLINGVYVAPINEENAAELLKLVKALGYTESHPRLYNSAVH